jgi:hypothetical protein
LKIVDAFVWCECSEDFADRGADGFDGARGGFAQEVLDLGEDLLDRVQVRRVFRQEEELGAGGANELSYGFALVRSGTTVGDQGLETNIRPFFRYDDKTFAAARSKAM